MKPVYVSGAAAVSAFGFGWRGLGSAVANGRPGFAPALQLAATHGAVMASEVGAIASAGDVEARARKLMSHPARLAAIALAMALGESGWTQQERAEAALYLGVGASGCSMDELTRMLAASMEDGQFSLARFGKDGLAACNPLFAFQLMNNFTMCHGAILSGTGGANGAFYSRGAGTVTALSEAHWLIASGECEHAFAGGADSALHPVTWAQLVANGFAKQGLVPGEGAALLALSASAQDALAQVEAVRSGATQDIGGWLNEAGADDLVVGAPWGEPARALFAGRAMVDAGLALGDALAAAPALAWCAALDLLQVGRWQRALVISAGIDGAAGLAILRKPA
jgi:3-oxoacyl-(acyl-carrier-protein) synthase